LLGLLLGVGLRAPISLYLGLLAETRPSDLRKLLLPISSDIRGLPPALSQVWLLLGHIGVLLGEPVAVRSDELIPHDLLLVINCVFECPKLLRLRQFTLHCPLGVIDLSLLKLLQLL